MGRLPNGPKTEDSGGELLNFCHLGSAQYPFEIAGHEGTAGEVQGHPRLGMLRSYGMGGENMEDDANWNEEVTEDRGIAEEILRASQAKRLRNAQRLPMGFRMSANPWVIRQQGQMQRVIIPTR